MAEPSHGTALGDRVVSGARWVALQSFVGMATLTVSTIVLARVLDRHEFGLAALALLAVSILQLFQDSGLHAALIQRRDHIQEAVDTAALYAPLTGLGLAALCVAGAPLAGAFFHEPDVTGLVRGLGVVLLLRSFAIVPVALLQRELLFAIQARISMVASVLQLGVAAGLALAGAGAWSVIGAQIVVSAWVAGASLVVSPMRAHRRRASRAELRRLLGYGRHIVAGNLVGFVNSTTDPVLVGRIYGAASLGAYTLGYQTGRQAVTLVTGISNVLVFPAYSALQDDKPRFRRAYVRTLRFIASISIPAGFGLAAISSVFVTTIYGAKWDAAIPVLAVISFHGLFLSISATTGEVFKSSGRPELFLRMGLVQMVLLFVLVGGLYRFGIVGFAFARAGAALVMGTVAMVMAGRILELAPRDWLALLRAPTEASLVMSAAVLGVWGGASAVGAPSGLVLLLLLIAVGAVVYGLALRLISPQRAGELAGELNRLVPVRRLVRRPGSRPGVEQQLSERRETAEPSLPTLVGTDVEHEVNV